MYRLAAPAALAALMLGLTLAACGPDNAGLLAAANLELSACRERSAVNEGKLAVMAETIERLQTKNPQLERELERSRARLDEMQLQIVRQRAQLEAALAAANASP